MLLTPSPWQWYSGMLSGWLAGHYRAEDCRIDLRALADAAGMLLCLASAVSLDALPTDTLLAVKPLEAFFAAWPRRAPGICAGSPWWAAARRGLSLSTPRATRRQRCPQTA